MCIHRAMLGFIGPKDIFRNPQTIFQVFEKQQSANSPFDLTLTHSGADFAVMGMHFKMGLYEHQSAGALQGLINVLLDNPDALLQPGINTSSSDSDEKTDFYPHIKSIKIVAYQPAFGIIGDPAKRTPKTRQSADHSMVYIVATKLRKALELGKAGMTGELKWSKQKRNDEAWKKLFLTPDDYSDASITNARTRSLMSKIEFAHGGKTYDDRYPDGIPTSVVITDRNGKVYDSKLVMYPAGHARNTAADLIDILKNKFRVLGGIAVQDVTGLLKKLSNLTGKSAKEIASLYMVSFK